MPKFLTLHAYIFPCFPQLITLGNNNMSDYAAVDFETGSNPWPIFRLQKKYNLPGKSAPLSS